MAPFLDPQTHDFRFAISPTDYRGDGSRFQKLAFKDIGEIDFIVGRAMTSPSTTQATIEGEITLLETIPEIITKKIYYRGSNIKPRDIFDIAAASERHANSVIKALQAYRDEVKIALVAIDKLNPDFVSNAIAQLAIKDGYRSVVDTALEKTKKILRAV